VTGGASFLHLVLGFATTAFIVAAAIDGALVAALPAGHARTDAARGLLLNLAGALACVAFALSGDLA
jgi:hypothetical protein